MTQEPAGGKLYWLLIILSIAIVIISAILYSSMMAGTGGTKFYNVTAPDEQSLLSVSGTATELIVPDTASISLGATNQATTAKDASGKNAALMTDIINALKSLGLEEREIRTSQLMIQPVYNYPKEGGAPTIVGYSASNNVQVTTMRLDRLGDIVDGSVAAGANQVSGISFSVSEQKQKEIRNEMLVEAVKDADEKGRQLASNLNVRIVGVKSSSIVEGEFPQPYPLVSAVGEKTATPIQPGESKVTLSVQVIYIIE